jgi:2-polyprenyl-3-methyl-5-hydroxy-6-metoxy-1,4-benzoquinol methylase
MSDIKFFNKTEEELFRSKEFFNQQWNIYQKVLNNNYMGHREIYSILHELLVNYFQQPFTMLELGCGDASFTNQVLLNTCINYYKGIDLSASALEIAKQNMTIVPCNATFTQGDFCEQVTELAQSQQEKFNVIFLLSTISISSKKTSLLVNLSLC